MKRIHLDFESRSRADIWTTGAYVYATDPSTEIMCLAYAVDDGPVRVIRWTDIQMSELIDPFEELRALAENKDTLFYAHNALFEQLIWKYKLQDFGLPPLPISRWRCTAAKALAHGLPKALKDVAAALGSHERKDLRGRQVMLKVCKPKSDGTWEEDPGLIRELEDYCAQDVETEREIDNRLPELEAFEQYVWFEDQLINQRGIAVDKDALEKSLGLIEEETTNLKDQIKVLTDGKLEGASRRKAVLDYFAKKGVKLPDFTKATVEAALRSGKIPPDLTRILQIRQELGLTSTAKYKALDGALCSDSRLRDILVYHAAGTGRWGGKLVQMQNLPKGTIKNTDAAVDMLKTEDLETLRMFYGNVMGLLSSCIRGMFISTPGHDLLVADYSGIEARTAMWFVGQNDAIKMFAGGGDIYLNMASTIFGRPITRKGKEREVGKQAVLGCGYGMGAPRFKDTCWEKGKIVIPLALAEQSVAAYRKRFRKVREMWYAQERAVNAAITTKKLIACGKVKWKIEGDFLYCTLPSNRKIAYHKPQIKRGTVSYMSVNTKTKKYQREETYGGKIFENIIQAIARDILAAAMLRAEKGKFKIVLTVHDELVAEVPEGDSVLTLENFINCITRLPKWAENCPIAAEGWRGKRYHK